VMVALAWNGGERLAAHASLPEILALLLDPSDRARDAAITALYSGRWRGFDDHLAFGHARAIAESLW
jgi:hypothetical protein